jgi:hypothetical protein
MTIDETKLMAYADGELAPDERAEIERALAADATLKARVETHRRLRQKISAAYDDVLNETAPETLRAALDAAPVPAPVIDLAARRRPHWSVREWSAMAASLAGGLVIGFGAMSAQTPMIAVTADGMSARGALERALDAQLASEQAGSVRIGLTFRAQDGAYCRTFELTERATAGLACRGDDAWRVAMTAAQPNQGELRMASAPEILAAVDARIAGEPLDAAGEAAARDAGWR